MAVFGLLYLGGTTFVSFRKGCRPFLLWVCIRSGAVVVLSVNTYGFVIYGSGL